MGLDTALEFFLNQILWFWTFNSKIVVCHLGIKANARH